MVRLAVAAAGIFSLAAITSCSQEQAEAASKSEFKSKYEQAAYEAALEAAQYVAEAIQNEKVAIEAYRTAEAKAQAAQDEVAQAEQSYEAAKQIAIKTREAYEAKSKEVLSNQIYLAAKEAEAEKYKISQAVLVKISELSGYKKTSAIKAKLSALYKEEIKALDEHAIAKAKAKRIYEDIHAKTTKKAYEIKMKDQNAYQAARKQVLKAKDQADHAARVLQQHGLKVKEAQRQAQNALQDVYMAAALAAFKHVAEAAIDEVTKPNYALGQ